MRRFLPKSLNGFLLLGIGVITVPLLAAIVNATLEVRRLSAFSQRLVLDATQVTRVSQEMFVELGLLERSAHINEVLGRADLVTTFEQRVAALRATSRELGTALRDGSAAQAAFEAELDATAARVRAAATPATPTAAVVRPDFAALDERANQLATRANLHIETELAALRARASTVQQQLLWESSLLIPLALAAALSFALGIGRPIRQVDRAITELGSGNFSRPVEVSGPVDLKRLGQQLEWLRNRLLELAQDRNRFLRHMSHELKTPLANIREGTELLLEGAVGELLPPQREIGTILQDNSIKLQRMIENLLSFTAWQSNSTTLELADFRIRPLIKQVLENQQLTLVSQRLRLDVQSDDVEMCADRGKIRLILENLLSNAVKYSPRGGTITVRARNAGDDLLLEVADTGAGIPLPERAQVFEAFHTGRAPAGRVRGTGIGLSVVQEFVQAHRGTIEIVDGEFAGAHFRIRMPRRLQAGVPAAAGARSPARSANAA
jgi:two-component system sensor histidine kinase GlrK